MLKEILYALSGILAVTGGYLVVRDFRSTRSARGKPAIGAERQSQDTVAHPGVDSDGSGLAEVIIRAPSEGASPSRAPQPDAINRLSGTIQSILSEMGDDEHEAQRDPRIEKGYELAASMLERAVRGLESVLETVHTSIGPPGAPNWSFNNRGYGTFRRILVAGESVAWLRLELTHAGTICASVKSHNDERALLNSAESMPANNMTIANIQNVIVDAMQPLVKFAARNASRLMAEREEAAEAWAEISGLVEEAIAITNRTLAADAIAISGEAAAGWDSSLTQYRRTCNIHRHGNEIARMSVTRDSRNLLVAVVPAQGRRPELIRQRQLEIGRASPASLAAAIAECLRPALSASP